MNWLRPLRILQGLLGGLLLLCVAVRVAALLISPLLPLIATLFAVVALALLLASG